MFIHGFLSSSKGPLTITSPASGRVLRLSSSDRKHLIVSWSRIMASGVETLGQQVVNRICQEKTYMVHSLCEQLECSSETAIREQCSENLVVFLTRVIRLVKLRSEMVVELCRQAAIKLHKKGLRSFDAEYWLTAKTAIIESILADQRSQRQLLNRPGYDAGIRRAWTLFLTFVIMELKHSFYSELRRKCSRGESK